MSSHLQHHRIDLQASGSGLCYRLQVWQPPLPAPADGFPVLWVLDGAGYHGLAVDMVRNRGVIGGEITPAVVVSVCHPEADIAVWMARRFDDFTPTQPAPGQGRAGLQHGGLDRFLDMLRDDALPAVAARCMLNRAAMALFGHSMGGLAVLYALCTRPAMFASWLAISPAIHWNQRELLQHEAGFAQSLRAGGIAPRVYIGVGALEQAPRTSLPPGSTASLAAVNAAIADERHVDDAAELAARLRALPGPPGYRVQHACLAGESHMSVPFAALAAALDLAFGPAPDRPTTAVAA
jgi:predicted alpha/beta superfamily hydrolase